MISFAMLIDTALFVFADIVYIFVITAVTLGFEAAVKVKAIDNIRATLNNFNIHIIIINVFS